MSNNVHMESLRCGVPVRHGAVTLLPIERVVLHACPNDGRMWFSAIKYPYALLVRDADGIWAIDIDAALVTIERLRQNVPELDSVLAVM